MMNAKLLMFLTAVACAFGLNSCLQVDSTISVKKDGTGTITEVITLGQQGRDMLAMMAAQGGVDPMEKMTDKARAQQRAAKMGEGVELVSVEKIDAGGKLGVKTVYKFSDVNKLKYTANDAMDIGVLPGGMMKRAEGGGLSFELADGKLVVIQQKPQAEVNKESGEDGGAGAGAGIEIDAQRLAMVQGLAKDMRISTKLVIEPGIAKTDASYVEGNTVTLADIQMAKVLADPEKFKAIQGGDFDKTKEALKGVEGVKFEGKDKITVEMK